MSGMNNFPARTHDVISRRLLLPLSRFQRRLRPSRRAVIRSYYDGLRFRQQASHWESYRKLDWILQRLRALTRRAFQETEYYRELFNRIGFDPNSFLGFCGLAGFPGCGRQERGPLLRPRGFPFDNFLRVSPGGPPGSPAE